ncbi:MAG: AEC family transporter [Clostridium sp.]|uniref:AEC family transporter n=1 Tax=Clostridium sp. TaxID=1506 RepID=UPI003064CA84
MDAINQVLILSLMMLVGIYARKKNYIDDRVEKGLSTLVINITLPLLIINSFSLEFDKAIMGNAIKILLYSAIIHILLFIATKYIYYKADDRKQPMLRFTTAFSNCAFMGYPILNSVFGDIGVFYGSIFTMMFTIFVWTLGVSLFTGNISVKEAIKSVMKNPSVLAVIIGVVIFIAQIKLPYAVDSTIKSIGGLTTPLAMMIIGSMLCGSNIKDMLGDFSLYYVSLMTLIVTPLIVFFIMKLLNIEPMLIAICTLLVAMPGAVVGPVIAADSGGDGRYGSQCIFITTLLSIITIPLFIYLVR